MAIRKLFPSLSANQTFDGCPESDICDPSYAYPDIDVLPPPLSPPLPPELYFTGHKSDQHVSPYVIIIIILLASLFLVVGCYVVIVKCCHGCSRLTRRTRSTDGDEVEFLDENHGPTVDHPIWYITTIGLQSSVINSITIVKYNKWDNLIEGTDCSVCLTEFQNEDKLRLLPKCNHAFHISCIDTWLRSHTNCPLCRAGIVYDNASTTLAENDQSSSAVGRNGEYHSGNLANGGEIMDFNQLRNEVIGSEEVADADGMENCETDDQRKENKSIKTEVVLNGNGLFSLLGNSATKVKTMKRSLSVNLDSIGDTSLINFDERSSCIAETIPMRMKRSFSCTGRSFLSRHFRSKSAILPF